MEYSPIWILMTTYKRTEVAVKTIQGIKQNFQWPNIGWVVTDDGTGGDHLSTLVNEIGGSYTIVSYDGARKGVGHNMNWGLRKIWEMGAELTLMLEDDWYLDKPFDPTAHVNLLMNNPYAGMIRYGYLSAGLQADVISEQDKLWLKFRQNNYQYIYAGHASLRHRRLHERVGMFSEGLRPGDNELDFCAKYNATSNAPQIYWPMDYGNVGPFLHIGSESLADVPVGS